MATKKKAGRPTVMNDETLRKLEEAFLKGYTDEQACLYANIGLRTLYDYCKANEAFSHRKEILKQQPQMLAKDIICDELRAGNERVAEWYLERKARDEFSTKTEVSGTIAGAVQIVDDLGGDEDAG